MAENNAATIQKEPPPCRFHAIGKCSKGASCPFSHNLAVAAPVICKFFNLGECKYGDTCMFRHEPLPVGGCKFFSMGECKFGDACMFPHIVQDPVAANSANIAALLITQAVQQGMDQTEVLQQLINQGILPAPTNASLSGLPPSAVAQVTQTMLSSIAPGPKEDPTKGASSQLMAASMAYIQQENLQSLKKMVEDAAASDECPYQRSSLSRSPTPDPEETRSAVADAVKERLQKGDSSDRIDTYVYEEQDDDTVTSYLEKSGSTKRSRSRSRSNSRRRRRSSSHRRSSGHHRSHKSRRRSSSKSRKKR